MPRRLGALVISLIAGCGADPAPSTEAPSGLVAAAERFVDDVRHRRERLESSLVFPDNAYSVERLQRYALGPDRGWDALPLAEAPGFPDDPSDRKPPALLALGRRAFFEYPVQVGRAFSDGIDRPGVRDAGAGRAAMSCVLCHGRPERDGGVTAGATHATLDVGLAYLEGAAAAGEEYPADQVQRMRAWGPGRADVTPDSADDPVRIPDLRALRHHHFMQQAGAVRHRDVTDLAIRLETLLITSSGRTRRPPRWTTFAMAAWLETLAPPTTPLPDDHPATPTFLDRCARCHDPADAYTSAALVPQEEVGTEPRSAWSSARGTGGYRVPSLLGVADRWPLLHDGSVRDLATLLDPERPGGHRFTAGLSSDEVDALVDLVTSL